MNIILYSSSECAYCPTIKKELKEWGFTYEERNVTENPDYFEDLHKLGMFSVPVVFVDDQPFVGYRPNALKKKLGVEEKQTTEQRDVVVIGTGSAGYTAAIYLSRADLNPLVIEGPEVGGQLTLTSAVENFPGFADGIMGPELMNNMREQAKRFGAEFRTGWVTKADLSEKPYKIQVGEKSTIETNAIVVATGASAKLLGIPGEKENLGRGVSTCATCDGSFYRDKEVIIVGGGDSAMEEAHFLTKYAKKVRVIHRRNELRASKIMQERAKANEKIEWTLNVTPQEVISDGEKANGLKVKDNETEEIKELKTDGIFLAIGHRPNTSFLDGQVDTDEQGYIITKPRTTETNIEGVFAAGDVQDSVYRQAITAAGTGSMAALDCERYIEESKASEKNLQGQA